MPSSTATATATDRRAWGAIFIRTFAGVFLIYMAQDNVFSAERMHEFERFLAGHGFPVPLLAARVSAYAQFAAGLCFLLGVATRAAAAVMVINFVVAILMVHLALPFRNALEPSAMLASALFLLVHGAGPLSVDAWLARRGGVARGADRAAPPLSALG